MHAHASADLRLLKDMFDDSYGFDDLWCGWVGEWGAGVTVDANADLMCLPESVAFKDSGARVLAPDNGRDGAPQLHRGGRHGPCRTAAPAATRRSSSFETV